MKKVKKSLSWLISLHKGEKHLLVLRRVTALYPAGVPAKGHIKHIMAGVLNAPITGCSKH
jgi:hypothetical protein